MKVFALLSRDPTLRRVQCRAEAELLGSAGVCQMFRGRASIQLHLKFSVTVKKMKRDHLETCHHYE